MSTKIGEISLKSSFYGFQKKKERKKSFRRVLCKTDRTNPMNIWTKGEGLKRPRYFMSSSLSFSCQKWMNKGASPDVRHSSFIAIDYHWILGDYSQNVFRWVRKREKKDTQKFSSSTALPNTDSMVKLGDRPFSPPQWNNFPVFSANQAALISWTFVLSKRSGTSQVARNRVLRKVYCILIGTWGILVAFF